MTVLRPRTRVRQTIKSFGPLGARIEAKRNKDALDEELNGSLREERPVAMDDAFPDPADSPTERLQKIALGDAPYRREYRLRLLHRMIMRNLPIPLIAQQMNLPVAEVWDLRRELNRRLKAEASNIDAGAFFGRTLAYFNEIAGTALRIAAEAQPSGLEPKHVAAFKSMKVAALQSAIAAENAKHRFLDMAGFYDHNRFAPPAPETIDSVEKGRSNLGMLLEASARTLNGDDTITYDVESASENFDDDISVL